MFFGTRIASPSMEDTFKKSAGDELALLHVAEVIMSLTESCLIIVEILDDRPRSRSFELRRGLHNT